MRRPLLISLLLLAALAGCSPRDAGKPAPVREVVLYCSLDAHVVGPILELFTQQTGIRVLRLGDTEATKTTGLVQRLIAEKDRPRADVWWSSEILGTILLSRAGVLEAYDSPSAAVWPHDLRSIRGDWYALGLRPRVIVRRAGAAPASTESLAIADPRFGTTRGHVAHTFIAMGPARFGEWTRTGEKRPVAGNAAAVLAVAQGQADAGWCDYDDYLAGLAQGWKLTAEPTGLCTPHSVALVAGAPHPGDARALIDFILGPETERALANAGAAPIHAQVQREFPELMRYSCEPVDWERVLDRSEEALGLWFAALGEE